MNDIRNQILKITYDQCLKLLDPTSDAYAYEIGKTPVDLVLDQADIDALPDRVVRMVQMGSWPLYELDELGRRNALPAIFIENGTNGNLLESTVATEKGTQITKSLELYPIVVRAAVIQKPTATYEESNPVMLNKIRDQLDYVLNRANFLMAADEDRHGFSLPSNVQRAEILHTDALEGLLSPVDAQDFTLIVEFDRMTQIDM